MITTSFKINVSNQEISGHEHDKTYLFEENVRFLCPDFICTLDLWPLDCYREIITELVRKSITNVGLLMFVEKYSKRTKGKMCI